MTEKGTEEWPTVDQPANRLTVVRIRVGRVAALLIGVLVLVLELVADPALLVAARRLCGL